ncbi:unnamed protein product [Lupinus luteus]|uniref:Uncharacterized protein n=1 Tax=Lupinus luteus TaxID=3873 RepID=A0AAV1Y5L4_LUPLU
MEERGLGIDFNAINSPLIECTGEKQKGRGLFGYFKDSSTIGEIKGVLDGSGNFELFPINEGGLVLENNEEKRGEVSNVGFVNKDVDPPFNCINAL